MGVFLVIILLVQTHWADFAEAGNIIYVNGNNLSLPQDGTSWESAYSNLSEALLQTKYGDEVWVARGTYYPGSGSIDRDETFNLYSGVRLLGGFSGDEATASERNPDLNPTILSGDIGAAGDNADNSYTILTAKDPDENTVIDGFRFENGRADNIEDEVLFHTARKSGGAIYAYTNSGECTMQISNCHFEDNRATYSGGAIFFNGRARDGVAPRVRDCRFVENYSGHRGGAVAFDWGMMSGEYFLNCHFEHNKSGLNGGAVAIEVTEEDVHIKVSSCVFDRNICELQGAAIFLSNVAAGTLFRIDSSKFLNDTTVHGEEGSVNVHHILYPVDSLAIEMIIDQCHFEGHIDESGAFADKEGFGLVLRVNSFGKSRTTIRNSEFKASRVDLSQLDHLDNSEIIIENSLFHDCKEGTVINILHTTKSRLSNLSIVDNTSAILTSSGQTQLINCNISNNELGSSGMFGGEVIELYNTILWNNESDSIPKGRFDTLKLYSVLTDLDSFEFYDATVTYPLDNFVVSDPGTQFSKDPLFVDPANGNYHLRSCSPAINAGVDSIVLTSGLNTDYEGNPRIQNGQVDIGPYEHATPFIFEILEVTDTGCGGSEYGSIQFEAGGVPPLHTWWERDEETGTDFQALEAGDYTLFAADGTGCMDSIDFTILSYAPVGILLDVVQPSTGVSGDGRITINSITGGLPPYDIVWEDGSSEEDRINLFPGFYTVIITDARDCSDTTEVNLVPVIDANDDLPVKIWPNPIRWSQTLNVRLITDEVKEVSIEVNDVAGRVVEDLPPQTVDPGVHVIEFQIQYPVGVYSLFVYLDGILTGKFPLVVIE